MNIKFFKNINKPLLNKIGKSLCAVFLASSPLLMTKNAYGLDMPELNKDRNITGTSNISINDFRNILELKFVKNISVEELNSLLNNSSDTVSIEIDGTVVTIPKEKLQNSINTANHGYTNGLSNQEELALIITISSATILIFVFAVVSELGYNPEDKPKTKGKKNNVRK